MIERFVFLCCHTISLTLEQMYNNQQTFNIEIVYYHFFQQKAASDKIYHLPAHGQWFSPRILASSTIKTGRHNIPELLLKVALNTINQFN